jgi:hypothetical protein
MPTDDASPGETAAQGNPLENPALLAAPQAIFAGLRARRADEGRFHQARLELRIALREWHARIPDYAVAPGFQPAFTTSIRSLTALPLRLG